MLRIITIISILVASINLARAQSLDSLLLDLEYRYFTTENDTLKSDLLLQKMDLYLSNNGSIDDVTIEINRVQPMLLSLDRRLDFYWNAALVHYLNDSPYRAVHYIELVDRNTNEPSRSLELLKYLVYAEYDTAVSNQLMLEMSAADSSFLCFECVTAVNGYELKHKKLRIAISFFIPGFGIIATGKPMKGILSLALNTLSVLAIASTIHHKLWINMGAWGLNLYGKFYSGNIRLANKLIADKELSRKKKLAVACELQIRDVLQKYPLTFRITQ